MALGASLWLLGLLSSLDSCFVTIVAFLHCDVRRMAWWLPSLRTSWRKGGSWQKRLFASATAAFLLQRAACFHVRSVRRTSYTPLQSLWAHIFTHVALLLPVSTAHIGDVVFPVWPALEGYAGHSFQYLGCFCSYCPTYGRQFGPLQHDLTMTAFAQHEPFSCAQTPMHLVTQRLKPSLVPCARTGT